MKYRHATAVAILFFAAGACSDRDTVNDAVFEEEFRSACAGMVEKRAKAVEGREGWVLVSGELRYLAVGSFIGDSAPAANPIAPPEYADPIPAIVDFHRQLAERGIDLIVVPVPVRPAIYPEAVLGSERLAGHREIPNLDSHLGEMVSVLREQGVRVIDLAPLFLKHRRNPKHGPFFLRSETHWTPYAVSIAARRLGVEIKGEPWYEDFQQLDFRQRWITETSTRGAYRALEEETGVAREPEPVETRRIILKTDIGTQRLEMSHPDSPVIVMGDSNTIWWKKFQSSLPHQLAFELGFPVDMLSTRGGGANRSRLNLVRRARSEPDFLETKRVVIWCFSARSFTNTPEGWIPIPL